MDAGPGTGKTAVACARIAWLIDEQHLNPGEIWLVSFTRTAVHELRNRLVQYVKSPADATGVKIATIDSHAWALHSGFVEGAALSGSFEQNIDRVIELIRSHEGVFDYLSGLRHLMIDEAQDVVGKRCELLLELIAALPAEAGVTVLADEAQAIYGFSEDDTPGAVEGTLPERIREHMPEFHEMELLEVHRTADPVLLTNFSEGRAVLRDSALGGGEILASIRDLLQSTNHGDAGMFRDDIQSLPPELSDAFLLFRKRGDALSASSYFGDRPHRLRLSGLPVMVDDWIGRLLWDWDKPDLDRDVFDRRWAERMTRRSHRDPAEVWATLVRLIGPTSNRISIRKLAQRVSGPSPPIELCRPDFGPGGPIVGTIHGAKGREAAEVRLYLPPPPTGGRDDDELEEEARVAFVGATRARERLMVGKGSSKVFARRLDPSGRAFTPYPYGSWPARACVEIGRDKDVDAVGLFGKRYFAQAKDALKAQAAVAALADGFVEVELQTAGADLDWRFKVVDSGKSGSTLCYLDQEHLNKDLWQIAEQIGKIVKKRSLKPPLSVKHLRIFGARTIALSPDDSRRELLHDPWRDSGFLVAPLVVGYSMCYFNS